MEGILEFQRARLSVRLGCEAAERRRPQAVDLDAAVRFRTLPKACETDQLHDSVCYAQLLAAARARVAHGEWHTVERLAADLYAELRRGLPAELELWLRVTKCAPPVPDLAGGVSFSLGDFCR